VEMSRHRGRRRGVRRHRTGRLQQCAEFCRGNYLAGSLEKPSAFRSLHSSIREKLGIESKVDPKHETFVCPTCRRRQRRFFTMTSSAPMGNPLFLIVVLLIAYFVTSITIFGAREEWSQIDCVYFAMITLTTVGFGDLTPTSDLDKIVDIIFIYIGSSFIGLLVGAFLANSMDENSRKSEQVHLAEACVYCKEKKMENVSASAGLTSGGTATSPAKRSFLQNVLGSSSLRNPNEAGDFEHIDEGALVDHPDDNGDGGELSRLIVAPNVGISSHPWTPSGSGQAEGVRSRHYSLDYGDAGGGRPEMCIGPGNLMSNATYASFKRRSQMRSDALGVGGRAEEFLYGTTAVQPSTEVEISSPADPKTLLLGIQSHVVTAAKEEGGRDNSILSDDASVMEGDSQIKYILETISDAVFSSIIIIAIGGAGFYFIEGFSVVDSFYVSTVLLTTVGYGDITPITVEGKMFCIIYGLIAGGILVYYMAQISMIPLEIRKRRIEQAILSQFGDALDDAALRELASGPIVQRLNLTVNDADDALFKCTREMFSLAMLVRLGRITEKDVVNTFKVFDRLDVDQNGVLDSYDILAGMHRDRKRSLRANQRSRRQQNTFFNNSNYSSSEFEYPNTSDDESAYSTGSADLG